ncbi:MAG TPA: hypothetical protein VGE52_16195, partial [Pirellulales bacterium]
MQPGGRAGKVGGKYEALWAVRRLLHVLAGELTSVTIEGVGLDEPGVDVWSEDPHGVRHAEQCKRKGGSASAWTIGQLVTDVLANAQFQLDRSPRHRFRLVTNVAGGPFESLSEEARSSDVAGALVASWRTHRTLGPAFTDLCAAWSLSPVNDDDAAVAVAMLKRCDVQRFDDGAALDADLRSIVLGLIDASASSAVAALYDLVTRKDNWGQPLDAGAIWRRL